MQFKGVPCYCLFNDWKQRKFDGKIVF